MTDKTAVQIANMKKQTIGVEVEMNAINRKKAAKVPADYTSRPDVFTGGRNNYLTWSAWDSQGREWKFQQDISILGRSDEQCELVTPILNYSDIETLLGLLNALREAGAKSSASRGCGVHIHVGIRSEAGDHTVQSLTKLVNIMAAREQRIGRAIRIAESRIEMICQTVSPEFLSRLNAEKPQTMEQLADI